MQNKIYERLAAEAAPKKHVLKNVALAFLCGGIIALVMQGFFDLRWLHRGSFFYS